MADDIDIEEHDVLDNPRIKNIFPDLTKIKIEVIDSDDEDEDHRMQTECYDEPRVSNQSSLNVKQSTHKNHIILGSKRSIDRINYEDNLPNSDYDFDEEFFENDTNVDYEFDSVQIKQEPEDSHDEEIERHGSRIILGSKPNTSTPETETHDVYSSVVMLEDWGPKLQRSNCYCKDCEILFPTRNCLDAHNMATHSFLVALNDDAESLETSQTVKATVKVNKAKKSTTKSFNFSTGSALSEPSTSEENFCNHCNKMFPSKTALIAHLYKNLTAKNFPCGKCDRIFNQEPKLIQHIKAHHAEEDNVDISDQSKDGLCNQCDICFCCFKRAFSRHMLKKHGMTTFSSKRVPFTGICKLCETKCSSLKNFNRHVKALHPKYFYKSGKGKSIKSSKALKLKITQKLQQVSKTHKADIRKPKFKCLKCSEVFANNVAAKRHSKTKHPEMSHRNIISKIKKQVPVLKKKSTKKPTKNKTKFVYKGVFNPPVPKSVLFKCNKCTLHFTNCTDSVSHADNCVKETDNWKCDLCSRHFKIGDKIIHKRQHMLSDRFEVHLTNDNVYGRTLCQCPKCEIYYSEQEFWVHVKQGCSQPRSVPCIFCDILIHVSSTIIHKQLHKSETFSKKDLILIEFVNFENENSDNEENLSIGNKRKISDNYDVSGTKRSKISTDSQTAIKKSKALMEKIMYYCEKCKTFWRSPRVNVYHYNGSCVRRKCTPCKKCGLLYSSDYHNKIHQSNESIFDYTFMRVQDNKIINPMPSYPVCLKCKIHFHSKTDKWRHICDCNYKICKYCKKMFSETAYELHVKFHEYAIIRQSKSNLLNKVKRTQSKNAPDLEKPITVSSIIKSSSVKSPPMPELLKKYELMTNTWNILYLCEVCVIVCDSYDKMVEHSQDHFNKMESYDMAIANCEICNLPFDGTCLDKHKYMHDENATLNRQSFNILKYNYMNLFSNDWLGLFGALPRTQVEQIVSQSIYVSCRNIRMRITHLGPPENTVYKCGRCNGYLTASMVGDHFVRSSCWSPRYKCKLCRLDFSMNICMKEHQTVCRTTHQRYREVLFNDVSDDSFNRGLMSGKASTNTHTKTKDTLYRLYQCEICQCCMMFKSKLCFHKCAKPSKGIKCVQCDLLFHPATIYRHRALHNKFPKLSKKTATIIPFKPESYKTFPKLYKCHCGLHFTSLQTVEKHLTLCKPGYQVSKENCSKCGLLFPTNVLVSHLCSHHSNNKRTEYNIQHMTPKERSDSSTDGMKVKKKTKVIVHKCVQCDVCFMTRSTLTDHFTNNHKINMEVKHCKQCRVNFTKYSMTRHALIHHKMRQISRADLKIKSYRKIANQVIEVSTSNNDVKYETYTTKRQEKCDRNMVSEDSVNYSKYLFMCRSCKINFLTIDACSSHYSRYHEKSKNVEQKNKNCHVCGLAFALTSLVKHMKIHHEKMKLKREDFIIIPIDHHVGKDLYKCDRCDVHFLTHRGYIKHCFKGKHSIIKRACPTCGYNFPDKMLSWHISIHHDTQKLSRKDFNSITEVFDTQLLQPNKDMKTQKYESVVTNRLYRCRTCSVHFCKEKDLIDHVSEAPVSGHSDNAATCQYCHLKFMPGLHIDRHINEQHEKLKLSNEFVIIENENVDGAYASRYLYKCDECNTNFVTEHNAEIHDHTIGKSKCRSCGLFFSSVELGDHKNNHHNLIDMSFDDFNFVKICETPVASVSSVVKLKPINNHIKKKHTLSKKGKAWLDLSKYSNTVYLCRCGLHYLTLRTFTLHIPICDGQTSTSVPTATCESCGLLFTINSLSIHQYVHHEKMKLNLKDFRIIKDIGQSNNTGLENHEVSADLLNASSVTQTESKELEQIASNIIQDSESTEKPNKITNLSKPRFHNFSQSYLSSLDVNKFGNLLFKCKTCHKHYITFNAAVKHDHNVPGVKCSICGLIFTNHIISKHRYIHHERLGLNRVDFSIQHDFADKRVINYEYPLYKCDICEVHFISFTLAQAHTKERCAEAVCEGKLNCEYCGLRFYPCSLKTHESEHHCKRKLKGEDLIIIHYSDATRETKENVENSIDSDESEISTEKPDESEIADVDESETSSLQMDVSIDELDSNVSKISTAESIKKAVKSDMRDVIEPESSSLQMDVSLADLDSNSNKPSTADSSKNSPRKNVTKLYKCGNCNVFYITQNTCYKHVINHKPLDSIEYIECKLCGLQFTILTLHKHMMKHHKTDFNLKNVLIEEYQSTKNKTPKIYIYHALDKLQSRLVSTTTESKDVSEEKVDSTVKDVGVDVDDNTKKFTLNTEVEQIVTNTTANSLTSSTMTEDITRINNSPIKEQLASKNTFKLSSNPIIDENVSIITHKDNIHPSIDQIMTISTVKDDSDTGTHKTVTETNVKDVIDHVVDQMMTESATKENSDLFPQEARTSSVL